MAAALETALQPQAPLSTALTEIGTLQLVFDTQFISKALSTSRRSGATAPSAAPPAADDAKPLSAALIERLDPVDWAAYVGHMSGLVRDSLVRKGLLLGLLIRAGPDADKVRSPSPCYGLSWPNGSPHPCPRQLLALPPLQLWVPVPATRSCFSRSIQYFDPVL